MLVRYLLYLLWEFVFWFMFLPPLRTIWLRLGGASVGGDSVIHSIKLVNIYATGLGNLRIGNKCFLGDEILIDLSGPVILENHVTVSMRSIILSHMNVGFKDHPLKVHYPKTIFTTTVKRGSFIGANSTVLPGVTIGEESLVGAGSVVTKDVASKTCVAGVPAQVLKKLV